MDAHKIKSEIQFLIEEGKTTYENCELLNTLCKALYYTDKDLYDEVYGEHEKGKRHHEMGRKTHEWHSSKGMGYEDEWGKEGHGMTREMAKRWAAAMENEDGTTGPHWTIDQVKSVMEKHGIECDPYRFWVAMNATYSDLCHFFKKYNINTLDAYIDFTRCFWFQDKDAVEDKVGAYYDSVVKH